MDVLVDVFYYDYLLTKIVEMYTENTSMLEMVPYLKMATVLSRKFREERVSLDKQLYLKESYVKILQVMSLQEYNVTDKAGTLTKAIECFRALSNEHPPLEDDSCFVAMRIVLLCIYRIHSKDIKVEPRIEEYTAKLVLQMREGDRKNLEALEQQFTLEKARKHMEFVTFENPAMKKFVEFVKKGIDEGRKLTQVDSPGKRIGW